MSVEGIVLAAAALVLLSAVLTLRELPMVFGIGFYASVIVWLVGSAMPLLLPAIGIAIVIGIVALVRILRKELASEDGDGAGGRYIPSQQITSRIIKA
jgi:hypothetical protein